MDDKWLNGLLFPQYVPETGYGVSVGGLIVPMPIPLLLLIIIARPRSYRITGTHAQLTYTTQTIYIFVSVLLNENVDIETTYPNILYAMITDCYSICYVHVLDIHECKNIILKMDLSRATPYFFYQIYHLFNKNNIITLSSNAQQMREHTKSVRTVYCWNEPHSQPPVFLFHASYVLAEMLPPLPVQFVCTNLPSSPSTSYVCAPK